MKPTVVVAHPRGMPAGLDETLAALGYDAEAVSAADVLLDRIRERKPPLLVLDSDFAPNRSTEVFVAVRERFPNLRILVVVSNKDFATACAFSQARAEDAFLGGYQDSEFSPLLQWMMPRMH